MKYDKIEDSKTVKELKNYLKIGCEIRKDPDFLGSHLDELEKMALDTEGYFQSEEIKKKHSIHPESLLNQSLIALAAPSFEGKTQSAFVFKDLRPLYFVANPSIKFASSDNVQLIYRNYQSISKCLLNFASEDYELIKNTGNPDETDSNTKKFRLTEKDLELLFLKVSVSNLKEHHLKTKFWILGLLK